MSQQPATYLAVRGAVIGLAELLHARDRLRKARAAIALRYGKYQLKKAAKARPLRIVVGSGGVVQAGWTKTEQKYLDLLRPDSWAMYFRPGSIDAILAEHVWEHLTVDQGITAAMTCRRYL